MRRNRGGLWPVRRALAGARLAWTREPRWPRFGRTERALTRVERLHRHRPIARGASSLTLSEKFRTPLHKIGVLYIRKSAFPRGSAWPEELRVTVDAVQTTRLN